MWEIRGLIVDDEEQKVKWLTKCFDAEFERFDWKVTWEWQSVPLTAQRLVRSAAPFHFAVIDLVFQRDDLPDETECRGLDLISEVCRRSDRTFVFAISGGDSASPTCSIWLSDWAPITPPIGRTSRPTRPTTARPRYVRRSANSS